ncbi:MAG TPA: ABC transporter ATP-binding protein, partial [Roseimicrobium sp.]|nr:ABC transporter ATP-binding protein [Roseimicrobium sp.]
LGPVHLTVPRGSIYGFVGPNGAGKTTTLDLLLGMGTPDGGRILVDGLDHATDEVAVKKRIGYVSPDLNFQMWGKVGNAIRFVRGFHESWDDRHCEHLLKIFRLGIDDKIASLSYGSKIKLAIVLALAWRPPILILDEPTVGLDAVAKHELFSELLESVGHEDRTVIISSHALADVERFADRMGFIKDGKMLLEGETTELIQRYRMIDCQSAEPQRLQNQPGIVLAKQDGQRCRVLVDRGEESGNWLKQLGAQPLASSPVTLEELFVTLARA